MKVEPEEIGDFSQVFQRETLIDIYLDVTHDPVDAADIFLPQIFLFAVTRPGFRHRRPLLSFELSGAVHC